MSVSRPFAWPLPCAASALLLTVAAPAFESTVRAGHPFFHLPQHGAPLVVPHVRPCFPPPLLPVRWWGGGSYAPAFPVRNTVLAPSIHVTNVNNGVVRGGDAVGEPPRPRYRRPPLPVRTDERPPFVGLWTAKPDRETTIRLAMRRDRTFVWTVQHGGETSEFRGRFGLADGRLTLARDDDGEILEGTIEEATEHRFAFRPATAPDDANGPASLTFTR